MATVSHEAYLTEESEIADVSRLWVQSATDYPTLDQQTIYFINQTQSGLLGQFRHNGDRNGVV
ncbi:hypothetical protein DPMN_165049 [Dreissena polymorpha]|uniref:Uncharacterized protein n=1 Tax=Dreissena polymorpha TaxID=45954 RepID=A0A9D4EW37_DREPO|nr:hypothetical protein DPMN_165049 [Dreissena polymorpha]